MNETKDKQPAKSSTQQLLEEITKLRQINEVLLERENDKRADNIYRGKLVLAAFTVAFAMTIFSVTQDFGSQEFFLSGSFVTLCLFLWFCPTKWRARI